MHHEKSDKSEIWKKVHKNSALECTNEWTARYTLVSDSPPFLLGQLTSNSTRIFVAFFSSLITDLCGR